MKIPTILIAALLITLISCQENCPDGMSGDDCEIQTRDRFIGIWGSNDYNCTSNSRDSTIIEITRGTEIDDIELRFLIDSINLFTAKVNEDEFIFEDEALEITGLSRGEILIFTFNNTTPDNNTNCAGSFRK